MLSSFPLQQLRPQGPCLNCSLIGMGSAIAYADGSCPQCGRFVDQE
jgi:hypothetical protein